MNSQVLIIGGGVIGLSIARQLHKKGVREITVVDRGPLGAESSWAAAGMLAPNVEVSTDPSFHELCTSSLALYPDFCRDLFDETGIDAELNTTGTLFLAFSDEDVDELDERYRRLDRSDAGVERLAPAAIRDREPFISDKVRDGLLFPNDWQVENRKLVSALRGYAELNSIRIIEHEEVSTLLTDGSRVIGARTPKSDLFADVVVLATGAWTSFIKLGDTFVPIDVKPIRGQMICFDTGQRRLSRVVFSRRGYVTPRADGRVLVGASVEDAGFDKSVSAAITDSLVAAGIEIAPHLGEFSVTETWAGLRPFAPDGLPVIGEMPGYENLLVATAHYRNGILLAPKTAEIIAGKIVGDVASPYLRMFGPERFESMRAITSSS